MNESNGGDVVLAELARQMVVTLDFILDRMMREAPPVTADRELPFTLQEVHAIKTIGERESITMSALATSLAVSLPTATHLVDRLVAKGVAVRTRPEYDRRVVLVALSEQSKAHEKAFLANRVAFIRRFLEPFGPAERERVVGVLGEIAQAMRAHAQPVQHPQTLNEDIRSETRHGTR